MKIVTVSLMDSTCPAMAAHPTSTELVAQCLDWYRIDSERMKIMAVRCSLTAVFKSSHAEMMTRPTTPAVMPSRKTAILPELTIRSKMS